MMTNGDPEGLIFLSYPHMNNVFFFFFCSPLYLFIMYYKLPEVPEYAKMQFNMMILETKGPLVRASPVSLCCVFEQEH